MLKRVSWSSLHMVSSRPNTILQAMLDIGEPIGKPVVSMARSPREAKRREAPAQRADQRSSTLKVVWSVRGLEVEPPLYARLLIVWFTVTVLGFPSVKARLNNQEPAMLTSSAPVASKSWPASATRTTWGGLGAKHRLQVGRGGRGSHPSQVRVGQGVGSPLQVLQRSGVQ